jgi:tetratricopeptide (TPR) repeat protein
VIRWVRRNVGLTLLVLALVVAAALYAPTLSRGLVNYDDTWLVRDNHVLQHPSWSSVATVFDPGADRLALGAEYLPIRDLSVMLDLAVWGETYEGLHLVNLLLYLTSIALVFAMLDGFGVDRTVAGLAALGWAVHPSHAESVAWLSERKGLLAMTFALACGVGYARFRAGRGARWLVLAATCALLATWSKAAAVFLIAALAGLDLALPALRRSWRRSVVGLAAVGLTTLVAFVPVAAVASSSAVVGVGARDPATVLGTHGFYVRLAAMAMPNALSYPIASDGPSWLEIGLGAIALGAIAVAVIRGPWPELRAASAIWLFGWLPASGSIFSVRQVVVADRYLLIPTLGVALAIAAAAARLGPRARAGLVAAVVLAGGLRTLDAQARWASPRALWERAASSNPHDGLAWSFYAEAVAGEGDLQAALDIVDDGLEHVQAPRLILRKALILLELGRRDVAMPLLRRAAEAGEAIAQSDLAVFELDAGRAREALDWARRAAWASPGAPHAARIHGLAALANDLPSEALAAFERAYTLEPMNLVNRLNLGVALVASHRLANARPHLEACLGDPRLGPRARAVLER